jgi:5,5'-dehydrodivanillate O-demethylase
MSQSTQGRVDRRKEQLGASDQGVIMIRKIILNAIQAVQAGRLPKGVLCREEAPDMITFDSFTGIRTKGVS